MDLFYTYRSLPRVQFCVIVLELWHSKIFKNCKIDLVYYYSRPQNYHFGTLCIALKCRMTLKSAQLQFIYGNPRTYVLKFTSSFAFRIPTDAARRMPLQITKETNERAYLNSSRFLTCVGHFPRLFPKLLF